MDDGPGPLIGTHVTLEPVPLVSLRHLYEIALCSGVGATWRTGGRTVDLDAFAALVAGPLSFALVPPSTGYVAGHIGLDRLDDAARTGVLSMFVDPRLAAAPLLAAEGLDLFLRHAFGPAGLAKVELEAGPGASAPLRRLAGRHPALTHEGIRRRHRREGGRLVDVDLFAVWPEHLTLPRPLPGAAPLPPGPTDRAVRALVAAVASVEAVADTDRLVADLGLDSLAVLELVDALDAALGAADPCCFDDLDAPLTVADLIAAAADAQQLR